MAGISNTKMMQVITDELTDLKLGIVGVKSDLKEHIAFTESNGKALIEICKEFYGESDTNGVRYEHKVLWNRMKGKRALIEKVVLIIVSAVVAFVVGTYY